MWSYADQGIRSGHLDNRQSNDLDLPHMTNQEREQELVNLWLQKPESERTNDHITLFYGWLQQNHPELVSFECGMDPYQLVKTSICGHVASE